VASHAADANVPQPSVAAPRTVALCGGVGGAKLAHGLAHILPPEHLTIIVNTGDDFRQYGLHISPDVDTVLYTLAGLADPDTGWGLARDTDRVMTALRILGNDAWFHLGDRDLATHLMRTAWIEADLTPTEITRRLGERLGVRANVLPMTDVSVSTVIDTGEGELPFQTWFVRQGCTPPATGVRYAGIEAAAPTLEASDALRCAEVILICPSNPYLSIGPILALQGLTEQLQDATAPVVAVSPIVGGKALKGPSARMLADLAGEASCRAVARLYSDFLDGLVIDRTDADLHDAVDSLGIAVLETDTVMNNHPDRLRLATATLAFARTLARDRRRRP